MSPNELAACKRYYCCIITCLLFTITKDVRLEKILKPFYNESENVINAKTIIFLKGALQSFVEIFLDPTLHPAGRRFCTSLISVNGFSTLNITTSAFEISFEVHFAINVPSVARLLARLRQNVLCKKCKA